MSMCRLIVIGWLCTVVRGEHDADCAATQVGGTGLLQTKQSVTSSTGYSLEEAMVRLADAVYDIDEENDCQGSTERPCKVGDWELKVSMAGGGTGADFKWDGKHGRDLDRVGVYQKENDCTIVFSGTDGWSDVVNDIRTGEQEVCGFTGVHKGFVAELKSIWGHEDFKAKILPYIGAPHCKNLFVAGHSLGGAVAGLFAAIANKNIQKRCPDEFPGSERLGKVMGLYTIGAPAVSKQQLVNQHPYAVEGCFAGIRFFNEGNLFVDWVAWGLNQGFTPFWHPKMMAVGLAQKGIGRHKRFVKTEYSSCAPRKNAGLEPKTRLIPRTPVHDLHKRPEYIERVAGVYPNDA